MKPCVKLCQLIRCEKLWPWDNHCTVMGMVPGHMSHCPEQRLHSLEEITEVLAAYEHRQWWEWSFEIAKTESITPERLQRWKRLWKPYSQLTEEQKDQDRVYARKVLNALLKSCMVDVNVVPEEVCKKEE